MLIQEAKRLQQLAGLISENQLLTELNDAEQDVKNAILGTSLKEVKFSPKEILSKMLYAAKKGILTTAIISSVLASCNFDSKTNESIKDAIEKSNYEVVDSSEVSQIKDENTAEFNTAIEKIDSLSIATQSKYFKNPAVEDKVRKEFMEYLLTEYKIEYYKVTLEYWPGGEDSTVFKQELKQLIKILNKHKNNIINLTDKKYFENVSEISKKLSVDEFGGKYRWMQSRNSPFESIKKLSSNWSKLGFNEEKFKSEFEKFIYKEENKESDSNSMLNQPLYVYTPQG